MRDFAEGRMTCSENGNVMVEVAILLPILAFTIFTGVDFIRFIQLVQKVDQSSVVIAEMLSESQATGSSHDMAASLLFADNILATDAFSPLIRIVAENYVLSPLGRQKLIWSKTVGGFSGSCSFSSDLPSYNLTQSDPTAPHLSLIRVKICVVTAQHYILSNFLPFQNAILSSVSYRQFLDVD